MKLTIRCPSGLRIYFEGDAGELQSVDPLLAALAAHERQHLEPITLSATVHSQLGAGGSYTPFPDPSPPSDPAPAAEPAVGRQPDTPAAVPPRQGDPAPPPARSSSRAGGSGRPAYSRDQVLDALADLGPSKPSVISERTGLTREAVEQVLYRQKVNGTVVHNGLRGPGSRWTLAEDASEPADQESDPEPAAPPALAAVEPPAEPITDLEQRIVELVHRHGPVTPDWISDQVVKNRRDTAAMMRQLEERGYLQNTGGGWFDIPGREAAQAA